MAENDDDAHLRERKVASRRRGAATSSTCAATWSRCPTADQAQREYIVHPGAVMVVPMLDDGRLVIERQYRYPLGRVLLEFPAGKLDAGEPPLHCALRELREETGYRAREWAYAGMPAQRPAYSNEFIEIWFARGLVARRRAPRRRRVPRSGSADGRERRCSRCRRGELTDAKTLVGAALAAEVARRRVALQWRPAAAMTTRPDGGMKVLDLRCGTGHGFEGWFGVGGRLRRPARPRPARLPALRRQVDGAAAQRPAAQPLGACARSAAAGSPPVAGRRRGRTVQQARWVEAVADVLNNTQDVGERFAEEARRIHYGESEAEAIRGQATPQEREALPTRASRSSRCRRCRPRRRCSNAARRPGRREGLQSHPARGSSSGRAGRATGLNARPHQNAARSSAALMPSSCARQLFAPHSARRGADAVLGRERAAEALDDVVDDALIACSLRGEEVAGLVAVGRLQVVVQVAVAQVPEGDLARAGHGGLERGVGRARRNRPSDDSGSAMSCLMLSLLRPAPAGSPRAGATGRATAPRWSATAASPSRRRSSAALEHAFDSARAHASSPSAVRAVEQHRPRRRLGQRLARSAGSAVATSASESAFIASKPTRSAPKRCRAGAQQRDRVGQRRGSAARP